MLIGGKLKVEQVTILHYKLNKTLLSERKANMAPGRKHGSKRKAKILYLRDILLEETDDEHGLSMPQLIERLQEKGIEAERKAIYDDLDTLQAYGLDVIKRRGATTEYAVGGRAFELPELLLLADAVQSSRFLTVKKSSALIGKLQKFTSLHNKRLFDKSMHVAGRIKMQNESIYYNIDTIQEAIRRRNKIVFYYSEYGIDKKAVLRREGKQYQECPIDLIYKDENYYLCTYNETHESCLRYRVDRMVNIEITEEPIPHLDVIKGFDVQEFASRAFGMFGGEPVNAVLIVRRSLIDSIIDRFGNDVLVYKVDENRAKVHVSILKSNVFFGWLAQFGSNIVIESPYSLALEYQEYLKGIIATYSH